MVYTNQTSLQSASGNINTRKCVLLNHGWLLMLLKLLLILL